MFFKPKFELYRGDTLRFGKETQIIIPEYTTSNYIKRKLRAAFDNAKCSDIPACASVEFILGIPKKIALQVGANQNIEEFVIEYSENTKIYTSDERGYIIAMTSLLEIAARDNIIKCGTVYDRPIKNIRGYRAFLPGENQISDFTDVLDFLVRYRYTYIMLEIGGAMEYERHPEINSAWIEYCKDVKRYSGRSHEIQANTYKWKKNSIHSDNGDGSFISKADCRKILAACRERGIEIIPECPTLSHCDYLLMAHPEIREREGDLHPDTYCTKHPDTYGLVFDVLDEVVEVFEPKYINIGHDELYSIAVCDRCKEETPWELFVYDVKQISEHLAKRGVQTMMWGDKLLNATVAGKPNAGAEYTVTCLGEEVTIPAIYPCAEHMPKGITYIHWWWSHGHDNDYIDRGYPFVYGNLNHLWWYFPDWKKRINSSVLGGFVSNWGSTADLYMQRNSMYAELCACAYALWTPEYDGDKYMLTELVMCELFTYKRELKKGKKTISVIHCTNIRIPYVRCVDGIFIEDEKIALGKYKVTYNDDSVYELPVKLGINIGYGNLNARDITTREKCVTGLEVGELIQLGGAAYPFIFDNGIAYLYEFIDPNPSATVVKVEYLPINEGASVNFLHTEWAKNPKIHRSDAAKLVRFETTREFTTEEWDRDWDMFRDE